MKNNNSNSGTLTICNLDHQFLTSQGPISYIYYMSSKERENRYREAVRYFENANEILRKKTGKKERYYEDGKYVRMACGTASSGVLKPVDAYLELKGKPILKKKYARVSVDDYQKRLALIDKGVLNKFNTTYQVLHLNGYYEGLLNADAIQVGLHSFAEILDEIKHRGVHDIQLGKN